MKTANLAIVFTDIKGFTERTSRQTLEQNERLLDTHARLLKPLFESFGGRIIKSIGDAFMVTFESPTQAVLCGAAIQDRLWVHNRQTPQDERLDVRVAINVGEVRVENKDVFGEPVNIAARVEGIAEAGEVFFTEAVYLAMNKAEVPSEEVGFFELKGIPGRIKVYRIPHAPYRVEAPAPSGTAAASAAPPQEQLPPFGNIGLARLKDEPSPRRRTPEEFAAVGAQVKAALAETGGRARGVATRLQAMGLLKPRALAAGAVGLLIVIALVVGLTGSEVKSAISAVESASDAERPKAVDRAEALIQKLKDPEERAYFTGELELARGEAASAAGPYAAAAKLGSGAAKRRLLKLLDHPKCQVRVAAARRIAEAKLTSAKGALEDLAEDGGPDDDGQEGVIGQIFGCNSKDAAKRALSQLE